MASPAPAHRTTPPAPLPRPPSLLPLPSSFSLCNRFTSSLLYVLDTNGFEAACPDIFLDSAAFRTILTAGGARHATLAWKNRVRDGRRERHPPRHRQGPA